MEYEPLQAKTRSLFPEGLEPVNNQLYFSYPYLFVWRSLNNVWLPLPTDNFSEAELANINLFVAQDYSDYLNPSSSLDELAEDMEIFFKGVISVKSIKILQRFVVQADLSLALSPRD